MKPLSRNHVSKHFSARTFRHHAAHTKHINMAPTPMRGGIRL